MHHCELVGLIATTAGLLLGIGTFSATPASCFADTVWHVYSLSLAFTEIILNGLLSVMSVPVKGVDSVVFQIFLFSMNHRFSNH